MCFLWKFTNESCYSSIHKTLYFLFRCIIRLLNNTHTKFLLSFCHCTVNCFSSVPDSGVISWVGEQALLLFMPPWQYPRLSVQAWVCFICLLALHMALPQFIYRQATYCLPLSSAVWTQTTCLCFVSENFSYILSLSLHPLWFDAFSSTHSLLFWLTFILHCIEFLPWLQWCWKG